MKRLFYLMVLATLMGCQSESLDIRAPYRIRLQATSPGASLKLHKPYALPLELLTDSYYSEYGHQLVYYQQTGLGRLSRGNDAESAPVLQNVPVDMPLGVSSWRFTPEATGDCQVVLIARQERGYTQPDTIRLNFKIVL
ncbi:MAG: hypothetical protein H7Z72_06400 [Bacteroidetes bacterium]|nr:hypothetical protein [Fibrella sp.]